MALAEPMSMANIEPPAAAPLNDILYRCIQCGIESKEATCFVGIAAKGSVEAVTKESDAGAPPAMAVSRSARQTMN
jgi:hypothetical protein